MLIRFHCKASASVTLFGYVGTELLLHMGMSGSVPGAMLADDVPEALRRLKQAIASSEGDRILLPPRRRGNHSEQEDQECGDAEAPSVKLRTRAYPLIQMLEAAAAEQCAVVWEDSTAATG